MDLVERVLEDTHLPDVLGGVRLVQQELHAELVVLALHPKEALVVHQVGDVVPLEELRLKGVAAAHLMHRGWEINSWIKKS